MLVQQGFLSVTLVALMANIVQTSMSLPMNRCGGLLCVISLCCVLLHIVLYCALLRARQT